MVSGRQAHVFFIHHHSSSSFLNPAVTLEFRHQALLVCLSQSLLTSSVLDLGMVVDFKHCSCEWVWQLGDCKKSARTVILVFCLQNRSIVLFLLAVLNNIDFEAGEKSLSKLHSFKVEASGLVSDHSYEPTPWKGEENAALL